MSTAAAQRPTTRSSLRQTLGLSSMGRAFSEAMSKDPEKPKRTTKDKERIKEPQPPPSSMRMHANTIAGRSSISRASMEQRPAGTSVLAPKEDGTLGHERKASTVSRRVTRSQAVAEAPSISTSEDGTLNSYRPADSSSSISPDISRKPRSGLRPKTSGSVTSATGSSSLPKYRARSVVVDPQRKASPARPSVRRRLSTSDDSILDSSDGSASTSNVDSINARPISPLPQRKTFKVDLSTDNLSPASSTPPTKQSTRLPRTQSPTRPPSKLSRKSPAPPPTNSSRASLSLVRTPSRSSTTGTASTSRAPVSTHKSVRSIFGFGKATPPSVATHKTSQSVSESSGSAVKFPSSSGPREPSPTPSPPRRPPRSAKPAPVTSPLSDNGSTPTATPRAGDDSFDVDMMLTMASPTAPTPAMAPRIAIIAGSPETPVRKTKAGRNMAMALMITPEGPGSHLRVSPPGRSTFDNRGSMTLEQLAASGAQSLELGEQHLLAEMSAPFVSRNDSSGPLSPSFAPLNLHEAPGLASPGMPGMHMMSPSQSLSQILLPEMTPSPAPRRDLYADVDMAPPPSAEAVMLRLQVAAAENTARERLANAQALERELDHMKELRERENLELHAQVAKLEEELRNSLHVKEQVVQASDDGEVRIAALEAELAATKASRKRDLENATAVAQRDSKAAVAKGLQHERRRMQAATSADAAAARWAMVMNEVDAERALIDANKETLATFLGLLDSTLAYINATT